MSVNVRVYIRAEYGDKVLTIDQDDGYRYRGTRSSLARTIDSLDRSYKQIRQSLTEDMEREQANG